MSEKVYQNLCNHYSNIEGEAFGILHGLEKFHHYCFAKVVCIIADQKPVMAIISKDMARLSQCVQFIHQYRVYIVYKPDQDLYIADLLSWNNHTGNMYEEISGMNISMYDINESVVLSICTLIEDIQMAT